LSVQIACPCHDSGQHGKSVCYGRPDGLAVGNGKGGTNDIAIGKPPKDPNATVLTMEATARTYRYLDPAEVAEQKRAAKDKSKGKKT